MINPLAGEEIASLCVEVILGGNSPFVFDVISKAAEVAGVVVPIPICAFIMPTTNNRNPDIIFCISVKK